MKHAEKWYQRRLAKYFTEYYAQYEDTAEYFADPAPNQWLFDIPELSARIELTCDEQGTVTEQRFEMKKWEYYGIVKDFCGNFDAIYEDYIVSLVGKEGFNTLMEYNLLESCGSINGRNLYTLVKKES